MLRELNDEVRFHLDMRVAELRARGMSTSDAESEAVRLFGDTEGLRTYSLGAWSRGEWRGRVAEWSGDWRRSVAFAVRRLRNSPLFTIGATLTLAIAIGATASVFGVVNGVLLKALPYREPQRVLTIWESHPDPEQRQMRFSPLDFIDYRSQSHSFAAVGAGGFAEGTVTGTGDPERVAVAAVTPNYFSVLGLAPVAGRTLSVDSTGPDEVVIGYGYWQRHFGGARSAMGRTLTVQGVPFVIVGVLPPGLPGPTQLWFRLSLQSDDLIHRDWHSLYVFGRLAPGITAEAAQHETETIARRLAHTYPATNEDWSMFAVPLVDELVGQVRPALIMVLAAAGCVLLIGATNLANLFLVRLLGRQREMALRTALGATRGRIVRELLAEAAILSFAAGAIGVGIAAGGVRVLRALAPATLPRLDEVGVDARVIAFCALSSIATVFIFGVLPAWYTSRGSVAETLKSGARGTGSAQQRRMQSALVVLQVVVALVLLTGAGLLTESFERFRVTDSGFRPDHVLTARVSLPDGRYPTPDRKAAFVSAAVERLAAIPGVSAAAVTTLLPVGASLRLPYIVVGDPRPQPGHELDARPAFITADYFRAMGISLERGRGVLQTDSRNARKVVVVDRLLANRVFGTRDPVGRLLWLVAPDTETVEIVGIVSQVKQGGLIADDVPWMYFPVAQATRFFGDLAFVERTSRDPAAQTAAVRRTVASLDRGVPFYDVRTMDDRVTESVGTPRFSTFLASLFALVALLLGAIGIYSVMAYSVTEKRREIGVRVALGASRGSVMSDVLRRALELAAVGIGLGSGVAWALSRVLANLIPGVSPHDPGIFLGAAGVFALVALAAASVPAFRATRVNPVVVLTST